MTVLLSVWIKGEYVNTTYIERNLLSSWERGEGVLIYNETGISYQDSGLAQNTQYYYQAWGWNQTNNAVLSLLLLIILRL